jgi:hypothetical protein
MDFLRPETTDGRWMGVTPAQFWSFVVGALCVGLLAQRIRSGDAPIWAPPGATAPEPPKGT